MNKLVCKNCKSIAVEYEDYVGGTSYYRCKTCGAIEAKDKFTQMTLFDKITQSPETLAEKLVYQIMDDSGEILFLSTIANVYCSGWQQYEDAYEWTLAKLKGVVK